MNRTRFQSVLLVIAWVCVQTVMGLCREAAAGNAPRQDIACPFVTGHSGVPGKEQAACTGCHESTHGLRGAEVLNAGGHLFRARGCVACHPMATIPPTDRKFAPPLNGLHGKLKDRRWLPAWLMGPRKVRPSTMMPDFRLSPTVACDISAFLLSLNARHDYGVPDLSGRSAVQGARLFTDRGCRACHPIGHDQRAETQRIPSLNDAGTKLRPEWVLLELEDPRAYNPDARIPLVPATGEEVLDIIAYLDTLSMDAGDLKILCADDAASDGARGREQVRRYGCQACHHIDGFSPTEAPGARFDPSDASPGQGEAFRRKLVPSNPSDGQTSPDHMPVFHLSDDQIEALVTFLLEAPLHRPPDRLVPASSAQAAGQAGEALLYDYGCRNCHLLQPGSSPQVTRVIDRSHLIPPRLVDEGIKVQPQWLVDYLKQPFRMRVWMGMGMPYFYLADAEAEGVVRWFRMRSGFDPTQRLDYRLPFDPLQVDEEAKELGRYRFRHDRCAQCHPADLKQGLPGGVGVDDLAIDLMRTKTRLRYEWVREFLQNPDRFAGVETRMPFIYFSPDGVPKVSDAALWLERVAHFLFLMDKLPDESPAITNRREAVDVTKFWEGY